jgi:hypothetical protein
MAKRFLTSVRLLNLSSDPESASNGDVYYNNSTNKTKFYQNSSWVVMPEELEDLSNVNVTNVKSGELLRYDDINNRWINDEAPRPIVQSGQVLPESPTNGEFFFNTNAQELFFFFNNWKIVGLTGIDLNGGTSGTSEFDLIVDGGDSSTTVYEEAYDAGNSFV